MSDLMDLTWNNPMGKSLWSIEGVPIKMTWMNPMRMSLSKWSDLIELKWIERFEVIWVNWRKWARNNPMGISLWVENECPYQSDLRWVIWPNPIKMNGIEEIWTRISEMKWIEWNEWFEGFDFVNPMARSLWVENECPYESDLRWVIWSNPIKMNGFNEKWVNRGE